MIGWARLRNMTSATREHLAKVVKAVGDAALQPPRPDEREVIGLRAHLAGREGADPEQAARREAGVEPHADGDGAVGQVVARSRRMIGRSYRLRATTVNPALLNADTVPGKIL